MFSDAAQVSTDGPLPVVCENCADPTSRWLAVAALAIAVASAFFAGLQLRMARREHTEFLEELRRRAEIAPVFGLVSNSKTDDDWWRALVRIGFTNPGRKTAHDVLINVRVPTYCRGLVRTSQAGAATTTPTDSSSAGPITDHSGEESAVWYLSWVEERVNLTHNYVRYVRFDIPRGRPGVPIEASFASDDFADGRREVTVKTFLDSHP